jgi:preprotein translocase subunit SecY
MFSWLTNAWRVPELRRRLLFTAMILALYRLGSWIPVPGVDSDQIQAYFDDQGGTILGLLNIFSGGALSQFAVFALGIMPYITASIILQLMTVVIPRLEQLQKEGEAGYAKINQYTRYLTVVLAALQAAGYSYLFSRQGALDLTAGRFVLIVVSLTAGSTLLMFMGELITKRGVGNGISLLIFASILSGLPGGLRAWWAGDSFERLMFPLIALAIIVAVVFVQEGQRRIPIQYAQRLGLDLHAPPREHGRRHPDHLRGGDHGVPADCRAVLPADADLHQRELLADGPAVPAAAGLHDHRLHVLLHRRPVQPDRPGRQPA